MSQSTIKTEIPLIPKKIKEKCHICNKGMDKFELVLHYEKEHSHKLNDVKVENKIIKCGLCINTSIQNSKLKENSFCILLYIFP